MADAARSDNYASRDMVANLLAGQGVLYDGTFGHRKRLQIADLLLEALRNRVVNTVDPALPGVEVKQAVLDLLSARADS